MTTFAAAFVGCKVSQADCEAAASALAAAGLRPAAEGDAHVVDERLEIAALHRAAQGYLGIINATLGKS